MAAPCLSAVHRAKVCHMEEPPKDREVLRVNVDAKLREDLERAHEVTGIRSVSDLVRYAIRKVAQGKAVGA